MADNNPLKSLGRRLPHKRSGKGSLFVVGKREKKWMALWHVYEMVNGVSKRRERTKILGPIALISRTDARAQLEALAEGKKLEHAALQIFGESKLAAIAGGMYETRKFQQAAALAEALVMADLVRRGCDVYQPLSPFSSCDLIAIEDGRLVRYEVKSGASMAEYASSFAQGVRRNLGHFDRLAVVGKDGSISYYSHESVAKAIESRGLPAGGAA